jgi:hypothetical protein
LLLPLVALAGVALFFAFLTQLLLLRYERGDIYPESSTLRADPLGTRAYFEALAQVPGTSTVRGFGHLGEELDEHPRTLFYLGFDRYDFATFTDDEIGLLDNYVRNGGRVVVTCSSEEVIRESDDRPFWKPETKPTGTKTPADKKAAAAPKPADKTKPTEKAADKDDALPTGPMTQEEKYERDELRKLKEEAEKEGDADSDPFEFHYKRTLPALWGFGTDVFEEKAKDKNQPAAIPPAPDASPGDTSPTDTTTSDDPGADDDDDAPKRPEVYAARNGPRQVEPAVPWKSAVYFVRLEPEWEVFYNAKSKPVLVRRTWGKGEIILCADSYFVSNEALRRDRCSELLSMLAGPPGPLLFDETHLGTEAQEGVMYLLNKFHLAGLLYALLGVLLLLVWRNSVPLVPPRPAPSRQVLGGAVSGKDSRSGLVNLLRRNIGAADILPTSLAEWERAANTTRPHLKGKIPAMTAALTGAELKRPEQIVALYHQLREINANRTPPTHATKS